MQQCRQVHTAETITECSPRQKKIDINDNANIYRYTAPFARFDILSRACTSIHITIYELLFPVATKGFRFFAAAVIFVLHDVVFASYNIGLRCPTSRFRCLLLLHTALLYEAVVIFFKKYFVG